MSAIKFACISPHPPIIVHEVGRGRAPEVSLRFQTDRDLIEAVREEAGRSELPLDAADRWDSGLDWSVTVPLYYLRCGMATASLTPMNVSFLSARKHFELGKAVRCAIDRVGRRAVIVASADLSHRLTEDGPYGFDPAGPELDRRIREAVASWDAEALLTMDEGFRERAGDDAVASISFLMGSLDGLKVRPRVLSYEGPFGVGYMVAAIDILDDEGGEAYARAEVAEADPVEPESIVAAGARPGHPLVTLARDAVEVYVRGRRLLEPPPLSLDGLPARAGCFVSLKTLEGALRGCIGSVQPQEPDLPREVVRNAV